MVPPVRRRDLLAAVGVLTAGCGTRSSIDPPRSPADANTTTPTRTTDGPDGPFPVGETVALEPVLEGFSSPVDLEPVPGRSVRWYVADQSGVVYVVTAAGLGDRPLLDVREDLVEDLGAPERGVEFDERGLLGFALHPRFESNGRVFVRYSAKRRPSTPPEYDHTDVLAEFRVGDDRRTVDPGSKRVVMEVPQPDEIHNAGAICFGPDGYLYSAIGDGGYIDRPESAYYQDWYERNSGNSGQDVRRDLLGSILRIDVDDAPDDRGYGIPDDNPLVGEPGLDEQFAWGFRNPWRMSFDDRGRLFAGDVGSLRYEEVNLVERGGNYGWNVKEGTHCYNTKHPTEGRESCPDRTPPSVRGGERLRDPIIEYPHEYEGRHYALAVVNGYVAETNVVPGLSGAFVFGDFIGKLFAARPPSEGEGLWNVERLPVEYREGADDYQFALALGSDANGGLYVLATSTPTPTSDRGTGAILRLTGTT